jgi:hypothetical protein
MLCRRRESLPVQGTFSASTLFHAGKQTASDANNYSLFPTCGPRTPAGLQSFFKESSNQYAQQTLFPWSLFSSQQNIQ